MLPPQPDPPRSHVHDVRGNNVAESQPASELCTRRPYRFTKERFATSAQVQTDGVQDVEGPSNSYGDSALNSRPIFGQWLKTCWLDLLTLLVLGGFALFAFFRPPAQTHLFPVFSPNGSLISIQIAYPHRKEHIPTWLSVLLSLAIPVTMFSLLQIRTRSFWEFNNATFGLLYAVLTAAAFQVTIKWLIGGLRPHFLSVYQPDVPTSSAPSGIGFQNLLYNVSVCTGDQALIKEALQSFPSGHTAAAFSTGLFTTFYLNAKLKLWSDYQPAYWKMILTLLPLLGATLMGGSLIIDGYHHWYDVVAGAVIGVVTACSSYRIVFASIWDYRHNHVPLVRKVTHHPNGDVEGGGAAAVSAAGGVRAGAVATRKVGWKRKDEERREGGGANSARTSPPQASARAAQMDGTVYELAVEGLSHYLQR